MVSAEEGIENLKDKVDTLIVIPNQRILDEGVILNELAIEEPVAQKLARLRAYASDYGSLDESARRNDLDLRVRGGARDPAAEGPTGAGRRSG